jgi:hypothetical protein
MRSESARFPTTAAHAETVPAWPREAWGKWSSASGASRRCAITAVNPLATSGRFAVVTLGTVLIPSVLS